MLQERELFDIICGKGISFWCGVPDSILYGLIEYAKNRCECIITANEGSAVGLAAGYYLATREVACVFMQNSGLGNAINPLVSLCDRSVYNIPLLLIIGWRGEPGTIDEPQHFMEGKILTSLLQLLGIEFTIMSNSKIDEEAIERIINDVKRKREIHAIIISKNMFSKPKMSSFTIQRELSRYEVLEIIHHLIAQDDIVVTSTGMISREWYHIRNANEEKHNNDFLNVGAMGHESQIALALSICRSEHEVFCIEGDGACLMHMGGMGTIGERNTDNLTHIVICNGTHNSIGGIVTTAPNINFVDIAKGCGYKNIFCVSKKEELINALKISKKKKGISFIQVYVNELISEEVGRPNDLQRLERILQTI